MKRYHIIESGTTYAGKPATYIKGGIPAASLTLTAAQYLALVLRARSYSCWEIWDAHTLQKVWSTP